MALLDKEDVKTYLKITTFDADSRISDLIPAVLTFVETYCKREFTQSAVVEYFHGPESSFLLSKYPVATTPALILYDDWSRVWAADTIVDTDDYSVDVDAGIVYVDYEIGQGKMTVKASYTAGYADSDFPADLKQACVELVARKLKEGEGALGVPSRAIPAGGTVIFAIDDILPQTKVVLNLYKR
jgi:hypothetical protein